MHCQVTLISPLFSDLNPIKDIKMTMWADNVKFVKDIIDSKYLKIDTALTEVLDMEIIFIFVFVQMRDTI